MLLDTCERILNERIEASTAATERLEDLEGKRLAVEVAGTDSGIVLEVGSGRLRLLPLSPGGPAADATLSAGPLGLLALARRTSVAELKRTDAVLEGKPHVAEAFAELLGYVRPELEAELADWVGDVAAHEIGRVADGLAELARRARVALERDVAEYVQEENPLLARRLDVEEFADEVDRLRDDVGRLAARVEALDGVMGID